MIVIGVTVKVVCLVGFVGRFKKIYNGNMYVTVVVAVTITTVALMFFPTFQAIWVSFWLYGVTGNNLIWQHSALMFFPP